MSERQLTKTLAVPEGVDVNLENETFTVKGKKGEVIRAFNMKYFNSSVENSTITISPKKEKKKEKKFINTIIAHLKNMIEGVTHGFEYKLEAAYKHFPMNLEVKNNKITVKNFLGEKVPRVCEIVEGVDVKLSGQEFVLTGIDKEKVGLMATKLEQLCRITNRDRRIFQDGIFITQKNKKII